MRLLRLTILLMVMMMTVSCGGHKTPPDTRPRRIVAFGDSLMSGYGLQPDQSYPFQLQETMQKEGYVIAVDNYGISGNTTSDGLARLDTVFAGTKPDLVIVALGANDMLRGLPPAQVKENLRNILQKLKDQQVKAVLFGMRGFGVGPFVTGSSYSELYEDLADDFDVPLYPFFLKGVAMDPQLNLSDGLHPNAAGVAVMVKNTKELVEDALGD